MGQACAASGTPAIHAKQLSSAAAQPARLMTSPTPDLAASAALRALIRAKRARGDIAAALELGRLGADAVHAPGLDRGPDAVSRHALTAYLCRHGDDAEAQAALSATLGTRKPSTPNRRRLGAALAAGIVTLATAATLVGWTRQTPAPVAPPPAVLPAPAPAVMAPPAPPIIVRAVGDIVIGTDYPEHRLPTARDRERLLAAGALLRSADLAIGNLEGALTEQKGARKAGERGDFHSFRMPPATAGLLREMGLSVLNLANNHSKDFGEGGLRDTTQALDAAGILAIGQGRQNEPRQREVRGTRVAFLTYTYLPYFASMSDLERLRTDVATARSQAPIVLVSMHAGREGADAHTVDGGIERFRGEARGDPRRFAQAAIDAGGSAVLGHGPHVLRPIEWHRGRPIVHSLGNFIGYRSLAKDGRLAHSMIAELRFSPDGTLLGLGVIPLRLDATGIPAPDYGGESLNALGGLIAQPLAGPPVLAVGGAH